MITYGATLKGGKTPPAKPNVSDLWFDTKTGSNCILVHNRNGNTMWAPLAVLENELEAIIDILGRLVSAKILKEELVERKHREEDPKLMKLWEEYKTLAKLKADYEKDLDDILKS